MYCCWECKGIDIKIVHEESDSESKTQIFECQECKYKQAKNEYKIAGGIRISFEPLKKKDFVSGVKIMQHRCGDGSRLEKGMSQAHIKNIQSRRFSQSQYSRTIRPSDYGSGKKVPKG